MIWTLLFLLAWTVISIWWFGYHLGDKYMKSKWWHWPVAVPVFVIATIIGFLFNRKK